MEIPDFADESTELFAAEHKYVKNFKKTILMVAGAAVQKLMMQLSKEQEILMNIADMAIQAYAAESVLLRVQKLVSIKGEAACQGQIDMMRVLFYDTADQLWMIGKNAINSFAEGDEQRMMTMGLKRWTKTEPVNTKECRQRIAQQLIEANRYCF
jgi:hypothetical protein